MRATILTLSAFIGHAVAAPAPQGVSAPSEQFDPIPSFPPIRPFDRMEPSPDDYAKAELRMQETLKSWTQDAQRFTAALQSGKNNTSFLPPTGPGRGQDPLPGHEAIITKCMESAGEAGAILKENCAIPVFNEAWTGVEERYDHVKYVKDGFPCPPTAKEVCHLGLTDGISTTTTWSIELTIGPKYGAQKEDILKELGAGVTGSFGQSQTVIESRVRTWPINPGNTAYIGWVPTEYVRYGWINYFIPESIDGSKHRIDWTWEWTATFAPIVENGIAAGAHTPCLGTVPNGPCNRNV